MLITPEVLRKFSSFRQLSEAQQQELLDMGDVKMLRSVVGEKLITRGSTDNFSFFLVSGTLKLIARDGQTAIIKAESDSARQAITQLRPRQYDVLADSDVIYLKVSNQAIEELVAAKYMSSLTTHAEGDLGNADIYFHLYQEIKADQIILPSLPDIALKINRALLGEGPVDATTLGQVVLADPAIIAKLIKIAIASKSGDPIKKIESIEQVIDEIGLNKVKELVRVLTVKDVFRLVNEVHRSIIKEVWQETLYISAIAAVLAEDIPHLDVKKAELIGLVHNVGTFLILDYLKKYKEQLVDAKKVRAILAELDNNISAMLLEKWGFSEGFVTAARESSQWQRDIDGRPLDYCDLIILSKLLSYVGTPKIELTPVLTELAVYRKLKWGDDGVAQGLRILNKAKKKMHTLIQVFDKK